MTKDMTTGSPFRLIIGFAVPMLLGMIFQQVYNLVDTMIVGKTLGVDALAGVGSTGCINFLIIGFCMGICSGFSIPVAQQFGAGKYSELRKYVFNSYICGIVMAILITLLSVYFCKDILHLLNTSESLFDYAYHYIVIIFLGIPTVFLYNLVAGILRAVGDSRTPVLFLVMSAFLNIILDLVLILGAKMGVAGAGTATILSQLASGIGCLLYMERRYDILKFREGEQKLDGIYIRNLCANGIPMGLQYSITAIGSVLLQAAVNGLGDMYVAAMTAGSKIYQFCCCPFDALGSTMATYAGQNVGAGKLDRVKKGMRAAGLTGSVYSVAACIFLSIFASSIALLFIDPKETEIIALTGKVVIVCSLFFIPLTYVNVVRFCIQGMGFSGFAVLAGVFEMAARGFAALVLIPYFGFDGACFANPLAWIAADLFLFPAFVFCLKRLEKRKGREI